ncbi:MAG: flagellar motor protein MotB [Deltaproteobacteria bacterium]|nr:flagellar motor protein MotB [Deltaproteobacteria bacterium]
MAIRRKTKTENKNTSSAPAWMVTYSDMVTLLLTFFVLMLSMAEMDKVKFERAVMSLQSAFGIIRNKPPEETKKDVVIPIVEAISMEMLQRVYQQLMRDLESLKLNENIELVKDRGAVILRVKEKVLFDLGSSRMKEEARPVVRKVTELVAPLPFHMRIEGHADNQSYGPSDMSNWDLSAQRAIEILKFIAQNDLLHLDRVSAVGYGDTKPLVPNDTPEHRALNRRVEFVLEPQGDYRRQLPVLLDYSEQLPF